jgi:energy-coupling factor transporter transmembrane protein EcfT
LQARSRTRYFWMIVFFFLFPVLFTGGETFWGWKFIRISQEGLDTGPVTALRLLILAALSGFTTFTTPPEKLAAGLNRLLSPLRSFGLNAPGFTSTITEALSLVPAFFDEIRATATAIARERKVQCAIPAARDLLFRVMLRTIGGKTPSGQ